MSDVEIDGYSDWILFPEEFASNQLQQVVGNCYMVSALESMSCIPSLLPEIYEKDFTSEQEKYKLTFKKKDGKSEFHEIFNKFPIKNGKLIYMKPLENEAYAIIFEKVWAATIKGGYKKLDKGGKSHEVLNKVLGTTSEHFYNDDMQIFDQESNGDPNKDKKIQEVKESDEYWKKEISRDQNKKKINPKGIFEKIRNSEKKEGAIITVSINIGQKGGHAYSVLGTHTKENPKTGKDQDFIILKNPSRTKNNIIEKMNIPKIEKQLDGFEDIKEINKNYDKTGVFYMPKEYFEGWFRDICICTPNYKQNFPKVYKTLNLYQAISKYYGIAKGSFFFDSINGNELIKTDIVSKEKLESLKKIIQPQKSDIAYVFDKQRLETIWSDGNNNFDISYGYYFVQEKNNIKIKKK